VLPEYHINEKILSAPLLFCCDDDNDNDNNDNDYHNKNIGSCRGSNNSNHNNPYILSNLQWINNQQWQSKTQLYL